MIIQSQALGFPWPTVDPFLFCAYHNDHYPPGNANGSPAASLSGRNIGQDFTIKDGWRMYHGQRFPGFPHHPHRGFETVTFVQQGWIDHADSFGGEGRYGAGDIQWMTAGKGIQHSEMFPLLNQQGPNPLELMQIWLNLPAVNKMCEPEYKMLWHDSIPVISTDTGATLTVASGKLYPGQELAPPPPQNSWAADANNQVVIAIIELSAGGRFNLAAATGTNRCLYFYEGDSIELKGSEHHYDVPQHMMMQVQSDVDIELISQSGAKILILQGKPIAEPVAHYGPFVMNTNAELKQAFDDYNATQFGGWPYAEDEFIHPVDKARFATHEVGEK